MSHRRCIDELRRNRRACADSRCDPQAYARISRTSTGRGSIASIEFPWDFYKALAEAGWIGIAIPEAYGGSGRGIAEASIVLEEVAASGAAMNGASAVHLSIFGMHPVVATAARR